MFFVRVLSTDRLSFGALLYYTAVVIHLHFLLIKQKCGTWASCCFHVFVLCYVIFNERKLTFHSVLTMVLEYFFFIQVCPFFILSFL